MAAVLTRLTTVPDSLIELDRALAADAARELYYRPAAREVAKQEWQRTLYEALFALDLKPFDPASVARYKQRKVRAKWFEMFRWQALFLVPGLGGALTLLKLYHASPGSIIGAAALTVAAMLGAVFAAAGVEPANWEWDTRALEHHTAPIPSHVLQTALRVKRAVSSATLLVDAFHLRQRRPVYADPFLVVRVGDLDNGGAEAYVEVWDEPTFK